MKKGLFICWLFLAIIIPIHANVVNVQDFSKIIMFTVSGYNGAESLEYFPVLVRLSPGNPLGFNYDDIGPTKEAVYTNLCFVDMANQSLNYEIDTWNPNGESLIWVSVPTLTGKTTKFYAHYGLKEGSTIPVNSPTTVWSNAKYVGVYHMNEVSEDGTSIYDASGNNFTATAKHDAAKPTLITSDMVVIGNSIKGSTSGGLFLPTGALQPYNTEDDRMQDHYSVESWIHRNNKYDNGIILSTGSTWNNGAQVGLQGYLYGNKHHNAQNNIIPSTEWAFIGATLSKENLAAYLFCGAASLNNGNGTYLFQNLNRTDTDSDFSNFSINSYASNDAGGSAFGGYLDEVRIRKVASSKDWIQAVYDSTKENSSFLKYSSVETLDEGLVANKGSVINLSNTTATIHGNFVCVNPAQCAITFTLTKDGEAVLSDIPAGELDSNGIVSIELSDLLPDVYYEFMFVAKYEGIEAYSTGDFTTIALPEPVISNIGETSATAMLSAIVSGDKYEAGVAEVVFAPAGNGKSVSVTPTLVDGNWVASTTSLEKGMDYFVSFIFKQEGSDLVAESPAVAITTAGIAKQLPNNFTARLEMKISGYDGTETLENFPVLVRIPSEISSVVKDIKDIRFISDDNTILAYEIDYWNPEGISTIWVSLPTISGTDTSFQMLFNPVSSEEIHSSLSPIRVWKNAGYVGVWHFNSQNTDGTFADASGNSATAKLVSATHPGTIEKEGTSANGSPWHNVKAGVMVDAQAAADWNFAETGYTTETWVIPTANYNRMFMYDNSNNAGNAIALGVTEVFVMTGDYGKTFWTSNVSNQQIWRFLTISWRAESSPNGSRTHCYENGTSIGNWEWKYAVSFNKYGMGLTSGIGGNGSVNYYVDEIRVRRGMSSADWVQANYDTQAIGTDFITYGELVKSNPAFTIIIY